ncbi:MAG: hypothetical protein Q8P18_33095 [Pseudomonadota bacterium]|nr:hypothetical protein [Pseudomonadota bacterium]
MDGSRKLTVVLGIIAVVSTVTAVTLALRPGSPAPGPGVAGPVGGGPDQSGAIPEEPRAPGGPNAIAAKAMANGGPRTPTSAPTAGGPRRSVVSFKVALDASGLDAVTSGRAWECVAAAGAHAVGLLDAGGTTDGLSDPAVAGACTGAGPDSLEGFVRVASMPLHGAASSACDVTVSYTVTRGGTASAGQELRGVRVPGEAPDNCSASLAAVQKSFAQRIAAP